MSLAMLASPVLLAAYLVWLKRSWGRVGLLAVWVGVVLVVLAVLLAALFVGGGIHGLDT